MNRTYEPFDGLAFPCFGQRTSSYAHGRTRAAVIERNTRVMPEHEAVCAAMASVKDELDAPVVDGCDPTLSLPDEVMEMIFLTVPFDCCGMECVRACANGGDGLCERARW